MNVKGNTNEQQENQELTNTGDPTNKTIHIFLAKENLKFPKELLKPEYIDGQGRVQGLSMQEGLVPKMGYGTFLFKMEEKRPESLKQYEEFFPISTKIESRTYAAVVIYHYQERTFVVAHGQGRHLLNEDAFEEDFGFLVTLTSIDARRLRSIDSTTSGENPHTSKRQLGKAGNIHLLDFKANAEILKALEGYTENVKYGHQVRSSGISLCVKGPFNMNNLHLYFADYLKAFKDENVPVHLKWALNMRPVNKGLIKKRLDHFLELRLKLIDHHCIMMPPDCITMDDCSGFRINGQDFGEVSFENYQRTVNKRCPITIQTLKNHRVQVLVDGDPSEQRWSAFKCLYTQISLDGTEYVLTNGRWYKVRQQFLEETQKRYMKLMHESVSFGSTQFPPCQGEDEGAYNERVGGMSGFFKFDKEMIRHGYTGHDQIEFCDLYHEHGHMIHVKPYSCSQTLGHLFNQGIVSARTFVRDSTFRKKVHEKCPKVLRGNHPEQPVDTKQYTIVFAVIQKGGGDLHMPFFAKVNLLSTLDTLQEMQFRVRLVKIQKTSAQQAA